MGISGTGIRTVRATVFTAMCVVLSSAAHVLLSGAALPVATVTAVTAAVFAVAFLLAGAKERRFPQIAAVLVPLQLTADTVLTTGQHACYGPAGGPVTGPLRLFGVDLVCGGDVGTPLATLAAGGHSPLADSSQPPAGPWLLLAAHLAVGLAAAGWLRCGEASLARVLSSAAAATFRPLLVAVAVWTAPARAARGIPRALRRRSLAPRPPALAHPVLRRGPPRPALA